TYANLLASMLGDRSINQMNDGVFVVTSNTTNNTLFMLSPDRWSSYSGYGAIGIAIVEGGKNLVISIDEPSTMNWNSVTGVCNKSVTNMKSVMTSFTGEDDTAAIVASSTYEQDNPENYAPGYCHTYSKYSNYGYGLAAGKWWLPSIGELMMIYSNFEKINYALTVVGGTTLSRANYWSSVEGNDLYVWRLYLADGSIGSYNLGGKVSSLHRVRPVSALQALTAEA
ncbi:MAG: hypothetical protein LUB83_03470, partial [Prevotellaceae bacterium]|nr:hypothetical protein [Prevotellaceae bacterium]